jgi:hypothetical protein
VAPSRDRRLWAVALAFPVLAGVGTWLLTDITTSVASCETGGALGVSDAIVVLLMVVPPVVTISAGWRMRARGFRVAITTVTSAMIAILLVYAATQVWWFGHGCYA